MIYLKIMRWLVAGALITLTASVFAGGPLVVCYQLPIKYPGAGSVSLNYDQGVLGSRTKVQADALVTEAVSLWTNVATSTVSLSRGADLSVDVTASNYGTYLNSFSDGLNPVIYDTDGSIIDSIFGVGSKSSVHGFAGSAWTNNGSQCTYVEGRAVINGYIAVNDITMKVVLAHEVGHLIGLDHTQLDNSQGLANSNYPLMYPIAYRSLNSLHEDDIAAVSALYPDATLDSVYGQLTGSFTQTNGTPIRGANIWAMEVNTNKVFSFVSDYLSQNTGYFKLLLPPGSYTLHAEVIQTGFTAGSSVGPYSETLADLSFQPPLYNSGVAMAPVVFGGSTPTQIVITAGCVTSATFKLDGTGSVGGNCGVDNLSPTVPTGLTATPVSSAQINLSWTASTDNVGVTGYKVYRGGALVGSPATTSYSDTGLTAATSYSYTLAACDAANNCSAQSNPVSATTGSAPDTTAPTVPTGLSVTPVSSAQINLSWTASTDNVGVTGYKVYRGGALVGSPATTSYSDTGLTAATSYSYTLAACDAANNCSAQSNPVSATTMPAASSSNIALASVGAVASASSTYSSAYPVAAVNNNQRTGASWGNGGGWNDATANTQPDWVQINFNRMQTIDRVVVYTLQDSYTNPIEPTDTLTFNRYGVTGFTIQGWDGSAWTTLATVSGNNLVKRSVSFAAFPTDQIRVNITSALASYSRITEIEAWGVAASAPAPDTTLPTVPTGLSATPISSTQINLSWTASTDNVGVTGYKVYRGSVLVGSPATTSYSDTGLTAATSYSYTLAACDAANNCSAQSNPVSATTGSAPDTTAPTVPTGLSVTPVSSAQINLSWTASTDNVGVTGYKVYRGGALVGSPATTSYSDTGLTASTSYSYTLAACDAANNCSAESASISAITQSAIASSNFALASLGAVASASSTYSSAYPVAAVNNNQRTGASWGNGGGWNDATVNTQPDWVQINFGGTKTIDRVVLYTIQDNYSNPIEPTDTLTFSSYGVTGFTVQGWDGSAWVTLATVSGNNLVKRTVSFAAFTTDQIRINVTSALAGYSRIIEIEAWGN